jgi:hypothetical protein
MNDEKNPDEIVVKDIDMIHFEMMDDGFLWCGIYHKNGQISLMDFVMSCIFLTVMMTVMNGVMVSSGRV